MDDDAYYLNREDLVKFRTLWKAHKGKGPTRPRGDDRGRDPYQPPEVYVCRTPTGGIPALDSSGTGTASDDAPGSASCRVYRVDDDGELSPVSSDLSRTVYNITGDDISGSTWVLAIRDKFGQWFAAGTLGGRWRMVRPSSENVDANGLIPGYVVEANGSNGDECWITLGAGEAVISGEMYEGEPLHEINDDTGTGTSTNPLRVYRICGNTIECAPDECDASGAIVSWARLYHRAPFTIRTGFASSVCDNSGTGTG